MVNCIFFYSFHQVVRYRCNKTFVRKNKHLFHIFCLSFAFSGLISWNTFKQIFFFFTFTYLYMVEKILFLSQIFQKKKFSKWRFWWIYMFWDCLNPKIFLKYMLFDCDKNWWLTRKSIEKQTIKISEQLNDLFQNLTVTKEGSK